MGNVLHSTLFGKCDTKTYNDHSKISSPKWTWMALYFSVSCLYVSLGFGDTKWYHRDPDRHRQDFHGEIQTCPSPLCKSSFAVNCIKTTTFKTFQKQEVLVTVQLNINFTHTCREHACVCTLMACNFVKYREYFNFARFGSMHSRATVHDNTLEYTLHE